MQKQNFRFLSSSKAGTTSINDTQTETISHRSSTSKITGLQDKFIKPQPLHRTGATPDNDLRGRKEQSLRVGCYVPIYDFKFAHVLDRLIQAQEENFDKNKYCLNRETYLLFDGITYPKLYECMCSECQVSKKTGHKLTHSR